MSHPAWDAWIEIDVFAEYLKRLTSHPAWDAWIEICSCGSPLPAPCTSHPAWDAWIEIKRKK